MIPRFAHAGETEPYPYEVFAGTAIGPRTSHRDVLSQGLEMQADGKLTTEVWLAYDRLRTLPRRLATDFLLYNPDLVDPAEVARSAVEMLEGDGA